MDGEKILYVQKNTDMFGYNWLFCTEEEGEFHAVSRDVDGSGGYTYDEAKENIVEIAKYRFGNDIKYKLRD